MIRFQREMMIPAINRAFTGLRWLDVDIKESAGDFKFSFEMPGAMKDDVKIWVERNVLTVSCEKREVEKEGEKKIHAERVYGKFERSFRLPDHVDGNNIKAEFVNGILVVTVPKGAEAKPKEITIQG